MIDDDLERTPTPASSAAIFIAVLFLAVAPLRSGVGVRRFRGATCSTRTRWPVHTRLDMDNVSSQVAQLPSGDGNRMEQVVVRLTYLRDEIDIGPGRGIPRHQRVHQGAVS